ncbi:ATP12 family protein [Magnetovibrio sp. PR-2]|uniref:ATP12 family chaperone protein n=1 Tax=Magnetovibrio sp. PR-2 TaxID=3120356 RepID=UPI002FCE0EC2
MTKRFYKDAAAHQTEGGFTVVLDGRPIKTPAGKPLSLPTHALAEAVAEEWEGQGEDVDPNSMPLMQLCGTAIDRIPDARDAMIDGLLRYVDTDLLCYRAGSPQDLVERQAKVWQPLLDWAKETFGADLKVVEGVIPVSQDDSSKQGFAAAMADMDNWQLTALAEMVGVAGSIVVGFAMFVGALDGDQAFKVIHVDEDHQIELWGEDAEATARREHVRGELKTAVQFNELLST